VIHGGDEVGGQRGTVSFHRPTRTSLAVSPDGPLTRRLFPNRAGTFRRTRLSGDAARYSVLRWWIIRTSLPST